MNKTFYTLILFALSCGSQTTEQSAQKIDVKSEASIVSGSPATLSIDDGSAKGTTISIEEDTLPEGSNVALDLSETPGEFKTSSEVGRASAAIEISGSAQDGSKLESSLSPMTLAIPFGATGAELHLLEIEKSTSNLCVFLKASTGLFVWRSTDLTIDETNGKVTFTSFLFGVYQLRFCGDSELEGFKEAKDEGATDDSKPFSIELSKDPYGFGSDQVCAVLASGATKSELKAHIGAKKFKIKESVHMTMNPPVADIPSDAHVYLILFFQSKEDDCAILKGSTLASSTLSFKRALSFPILQTDLAAKTASGKIGEGNYSLKKVSLKTSVPKGNIEQLQPTPVKTLCVKGKSDASSGHTLAAMEINSEVNSVGKFGTEEALDIYIPTGLTAGKQHVEVKVGEACVHNSSTSVNEISEPYTIRLETADAETYYMAAAELKIKESDISETYCYSVFYGGGIAASATPLAAWTVKANSPLKVYIPYDNRKLNGQNNPTYDVQLAFAGCEDNAGSTPPLVLNDVSLDTNFNIDPATLLTADTSSLPSAEEVSAAASGE